MKKLFVAALFATVALGAPFQQAGATLVDGPEEIERARELRLQARQISENFQEYGAASKLYRRAAELFGDTPEAADAWAMAGKLAYYSGDNRAASDLRAAGEIALEFGRVGFAARAFLDGAWVAHKGGMNRTALDLATRGQKLAESPLLADAEREDLKRRVVARTAEIGQ